MWIDRIVTELPTGPEIVDLHQRLTVISSTDDRRRRDAYERIVRALRVHQGTQIEIRTDYGESVVASRPSGRPAALIDATTHAPIPHDRGGLGIIGQVNDPHAMEGHLATLHVTPLSLQQRAHDDAAAIDLAQRPLDQLWEVAIQLQADRDKLNTAINKHSDLDAAARERQSREASVDEFLAQQQESAKKAQLFFIVAGVVALLGVASVLLINTLLGLLMILAGAGVAVTAWYIGQEAEELDEELPDTALGVQLGRVDELFDSVSAGRNQRSAQETLHVNEQRWAELAGPNADPMVLLRERTRIEELANNIRFIADVPAPAEADPTILLGFASLLAELSRRFPAERVPLLIDDLFVNVHPAYHGALRELIVRASHRRQVVVETADLDACTWAATEAIAGNALLITDQSVATDAGTAAA